MANILKLNDNEKRILKIWSDKAIHGGHWGDGDFFLPEEQITHDKIFASENNEIELTKKELEILNIWASREGFTPEEAHLKEKLKIAYENAEGY